MNKVLTAAIEAERSVKITRLRAVDYLRVSTAEQAKGYGVTYTGKRTRAHTGKKGWEHVCTYADEGFSGSLDHTQRPDLRRLMADAQKVPRPFDVVVVAEERAIGRRDRAFWPWVWKLEDFGIRVAVVRGDYDNTTEEGRSKMRKEQDKAEDERITIRDRTQGGVQEKAEIGGHPGGVAPYGYRIENKGVKGESRIVPDTGDETAAVSILRRAYTLIVEEGKNPGQAEDLFNSEGIHGPTKDYWPRGSLRHVLTGNAIQTATRVYRDPNGPKVRLDEEGKPLFGATVEIKLKPIFNEMELKRLNTALARSARRVRPQSEGDVVHPLSKHLFGLCGNYYTGVSEVGRAHSRVYRCAGTYHDYKNPNKEKCGCSQIDAAAVDKRVWAEVCQLLEDPKRLNSLSADWTQMAEANSVDYEKRIIELNEQIDELDETIDVTMVVAARSAVRKKLSREESEKAVDRAVQALNTDRENLAALRDEVLSWQVEASSAINRASDLKELASLASGHLFGMTASEQAEIIHLLDVKVTILEEIPRKTRSDDKITSWFADRDRVVPLLTDDAWAIVEPIINSRKGRKPQDARALVDSMLNKARTGRPWSGSASVWTRWLKSGLWKTLMDALVAMPGTPPAPSITLPRLRVEGRIDPRLFINEDESDDQEDLFKDSDYKISPFELESALLEHEAVTEAAVVPAPDPLRLAVPKAYVVLAEGWEPGPETAKLLFAHARSVLAPYQRIRRIEFAALPKTVSGKIRRIELREATAKGSDAEYVEGDLR